MSEKAHKKIEALLHDTGWHVQTFSDFDQHAAPGLAILNYPLARSYGNIDCLLFIEGKALGFIEILREDQRLCGIPVGQEKYRRGLPFSLRLYTRPLPFLYQTNGSEICFTNAFDPAPKARRLQSLHRPETLHSWIADGIVGETPRDMAAAYFPEYRRRGRTFHERVLINIPELETKELSGIAIKPLQVLEDQLKKNKRRILMPLDSSSKGRAAMCLIVQRLLRFVNARRILILLNREQDIEPIMRSLEKRLLVDNEQTAPDTFLIQSLNEEDAIDLNARVCVSSIRQMDRLLKESTAASLPIETFEVMLIEVHPIDPCVAPVLSQYRTLLSYFDACLIGLSQRPDPATLDFFRESDSDIAPQEDGLKVLRNL